VVTSSGGRSLVGPRTRIPFGVSVYLAVFLLFIVSCSESETSASQISQEEGAEESSTDQPNMIFVLADDLDFASAQKMPQIRSLLIEEGISLERAFVSHPVCCPSRTTILTGLYVHNHDVRTNLPPDGGFQKFLSEGHEENTIALGLQRGGYRTAFFGKYLNGYGEEDPTHVPPGWDEWHGKLDEQKLYDYRINENGEIVSYGNETEDFFTDVLSNQATNFVRRAASDPQGRPFFAYVAPTAPHAPATPAERHEGAFANEAVPSLPSFDEEDVSDKPPPIGNAQPLSEEDVSNIDAYYRQRLESMLAVDEMIDSLVQELEAAGELENTFILFTSDNGWFQGEHRVRSGKNRPYEESARVPLFVRGPGVPTGSKTDGLTLNTDFAPTFADLAAVDFRADGRSLVPLLSGEEPTSWRSAVLLERLPIERGGGGGKARGKGKTGPGGVPQGPSGGSPAFEAVRTEVHKYIEYDGGEKELYDLQADPYEVENVYETVDPSLLEDLKAKLEALKSCSREGCQKAEDVP
jgi:N-acetylglucosamine-6-sulfatase